jgi:POT family proton-dependent oligopeptide transporter
MRQQGISNDTMFAIAAIACIIMGPIIQNLLFPFLRRRRIRFGPIMRMTLAFIFIALALSYAAGLQRFIYSRGPCFWYPLQCSAGVEGSTGTTKPNDVSLWLQTPLYFLFAIGEILALVSLSEYTYLEAPPNLKALVQASQELAAAVGAAIGIALSPVSKNPWLVTLFACLAGSMVLLAVIFWATFRNNDAEYDNVDTERTEESE